MDKDPILAALVRIEAKQDQFLENQELIEQELAKIRAETNRIAVSAGVTAGGVAGAVSGGLVATSIAFIRAKLGF